MSMQLIVKKFGGALSKNSPTILTGLGIMGLLTTVSMAITVTPRALDLITEGKQNRIDEYLKTKYGSNDKVEVIYPKELTKKDIILLTWKEYVPVAITALLTIGCIVGANRVNLKRNAALLSLYGLSEAALKEYQKKVIETIGKGKEREIRDDIHRDRITNNPVNTKEIIVTGKGESLCHDAWGGGYFYSDIEHIRQTLNKLSRDLMSENYITLNEVYSGLGLRDTKLGDLVGWHIDDGLIEPEFSSQLTAEGVPCLVLDYVVEPRLGYNNY